MKKISIIVPIFNSEKCLRRCFDSLIAQSMRELEIVAVDDGSTDNSLKVLKEYEGKDERLRVMSKKNEGPSLARACGVKESRGEYLMFVDADDWIEPDACEVAYDTARKYDADIVMWSYLNEYKGASTPKEVYKDNVLVFEKAEVRNKLHRRFFGLRNSELSAPEDADRLSTMWAKLYKSKIVKQHDIKFIANRLIGTYEDGMFNLQVFYLADRVVYIRRALYHYTKMSSNAFTSKYKDDLPEKWEFLYKLMEDYIQTHSLGDDYHKALDNRVCLSILGIGLQEVSKRNPHNIFQRIAKIKKVLSGPRYVQAYQKLEMKHLPFPWKALMFFSRWRFAAGVYALLWCAQKLRER